MIGVCHFSPIAMTSSVSVRINDARHLRFALYDVLDAEGLTALPHFSMHSRDTFDAALDLAQRIALEKFAPHNRKSDLNEPLFVDGKVALIPEIGDAVAAYNEAGFTAASIDAQRGGMQMPFMVTTACDTLFAAANAGTVAYPSLARGVANLLLSYGTPTQIERYAQPIIDGRFFGTMCLSEPQAGSSLADIRCRAELQADGSYRLSGAKMWISAGDHELGENIIHLVLARIVDAPLGVRGISLFIVPRFRVDPDGTRAARNDVQLAGLNHKMGQRGSVNTFLKFGENGDCYAELVGQPHQGLGYMFHMMNEERIGVGVGAISQGIAGYLYSLDYARERRQGRHPDQKDPATMPIALIEHADVRRMLLAQRAYVEGAHVLALYSARLVDQMHDPLQRDRSALLLELLTPIVKAWSSDYSLRANEMAIQVLGGYGYTRDYPVEQYYRDNRINPIHEGTNGIQALDLLGRKVTMQNGAALRALIDEINLDIDAARALEELKELADQLGLARDEILRASQHAAQRMGAGDVRAALANASFYLQALGHVCIAWIWLKQARIALGADIDADFAAGKLATCRFFFATELPQVWHWCKIVVSDDSALTMRDGWF